MAQMAQMNAGDDGPFQPQRRGGAENALAGDLQLNALAGLRDGCRFLVVGGAGLLALMLWIPTTIERLREQNTAGGCRLQLVPAADIATFPDEIRGTLPSDIVLVDDAVWYTIEPTRWTQEFDEEWVNADGAQYSAADLACVIPKDRANLLHGLWEMHHGRFVVLHYDMNGTVKVMGSKTEPAIVRVEKLKHGDQPGATRNQYELVITVRRRSKCPFYLATPPAASIGGGSPTPPVMPAAHASTHQHGGSDEVATGTAAPYAIPKADATGKLDAAWLPSPTPASHASSHQHGGADEVATATPGANAIPKADSSGFLDPGWIPALKSHEFVVVADSTARLALSTSQVQLGDEAFQTDTAETYKLIGADPSNPANWQVVADTTPDWSSIQNKPSTFAPSAHAASHQHGGGDEIATATAAANAIPKADATGKLDAAWLPAVAPSSHASTHQHGGGDEIATATPSANAIPKADSNGFLDPGWIPALKSHEFVVVANSAARLALSTSQVQLGDEAFQSDTSETYKLIGADPSNPAHWQVVADTTPDWSSIQNKPSTFAPSAHASSHEVGGADEISVDGLSGQLADPQEPESHAASHQHGGTDELATETAGAYLIPKADASGRLSSSWIPPIAPISHASSHQHGGGDEIATATPSANAIPKADSNGFLDPGWIPALKSHEFVVVADSAARLALSTSAVQLGDEAFQTDTSETYKLIGADPSNPAHWQVVADTTPDWSSIQSKPSTFAPSTHASSHQHGGGDEVATATPAANAIPKAGGSGALADGWVPNHLKGPGSSENNRLMVFDGTSGKLAKDNSKVTVTEEGGLNSLEPVSGPCYNALTNNGGGVGYQVYAQGTDVAFFAETEGGTVLYVEYGGAIIQALSSDTEDASIDVCNISTGLAHRSKVDNLLYDIAHFLNSDNKGLQIYNDGGLGWNSVTGALSTREALKIFVGTTAPSSPDTDTLWVDTN